MKFILNIYQDSIKHGSLRRSDKAKIKQYLRSHHASPDQRHRLRHYIFDMARLAMDSYPPQHVLDWLEDANKSTLLGRSQTDQHLAFFTPGDDCVQILIEQLLAAQSSIFACIFTISDDRIAESLIRKHRQGVGIRIITDNDKAFDLGSDIGRLKAAGIDVRTDTAPDHMHHKFAILDQQVLLTGSYNWTRSAAEYNLENLLITRTRPLVEAYMAEFDRLWTLFST